VLLDEITIAINKLRETVESTIPQGESPSFLRNITSELVDVKEPYPMPWFSFSIRNYGPNSVYLGVNRKPEIDPKYGDEIRKGETREVDMGAPKIDKIYLQCLSGETASVRVRGVY